VETGKYSPSVDFVIELARVFGVSVDAILGEHEDGIQEVRIENKDLVERLRLLESLDEDERQALIKVMDSMLTKKKVIELLTEKRVA
jgi:DNA-binding XRE family transcriptional regulator